ncbi:hypothetical protein PCANC_24808 [Puccinia coronata f. sp. avenae]|uniref:Uncharacterized protein n=1 Tax=Puccinia coronata f. sp. avenae TaxID=200324 RepID=A0A2N5TP54_9BASI|nr:hypothetical protein PCANC_24808 [Puccinia coronata f. sp. avenae]PLW44519.1 hypothetical protein PCASD_11470 [Puccinia coronata f. sp. avenae]
MSIDPSPHNQVALRGQEMSMDTKIPAQDKLTTISNIFQGQWLLFVNTKESGNYRLMRIVLNQAISTQDTLTKLFGTQRMLEVSDRWLARDKLARMERMFQIPLQPLPQPVAEQPVVNPHSLSNSFSFPSLSSKILPLRSYFVLPNRSARLLRIRGQHSNSYTLQALPHPPQTYKAQEQHPANDLAEPLPVPGSMIPRTGHQLGTLPAEAQHQYPDQEAYYGQEAYYYPPQPPHQAHHPYVQSYPNGNQLHHPYQRSRCRADPMTWMLQVGNFFMRSERMINHSQRRRGRGGMAPPAYLSP